MTTKTNDILFDDPRGLVGNTEDVSFGSPVSVSQIVFAALREPVAKRVVVDKNKSLAEKIDAPWEEISGMGSDKHLAKKIIFCFNYDTDDVLPIFKTSDLEHFLEKTTTDPILDNYPRLTMGEKYQFLTSELIKTKEKIPQTKSWGPVYFSRFLYETFPPPRDLITLEKKKKRKKKNKSSINKKNMQNLSNCLTN